MADAPIAPWAKTGAWATAVDEEAAANGGSLPPVPTAAFPALGGNDDAFPSLGQAATIKESKKDKKKKGGKGQTLNLSEFLGGGAPSRSSRALDDATLLMQLPKGPSSRPDDEDAGPGLGGAFTRYGGDRGGARYGERNTDRDDRYGDRRPPREDEGPSRADETDDWGREKKYVPSGGGFGGGGGFGERRGGFGDRERGGFGDREQGGFDRPPRDEGPSRADEADSWGRKPAAGGFGQDRYEDRGRGGFDDRPRRQYELGSARSEDADEWRRREPLQAEAARASAADAVDRWGSRREISTPAERGTSRERPKLKLAPRSVPLEGPPRPASAASNEGSEGRAPKSNPFGAARPREEVLKEQGRDFIKEDLKLEHKVAREETAEEKALKEKLEGLKKTAEESPDEQVTVEELGEEALPAKDAAAALEEKLLKLTLELDDRARFSRAPGRHGEHGDRDRHARLEHDSRHAPREAGEHGPRHEHAERGAEQPPHREHNEREKEGEPRRAEGAERARPRW